MNQSTISRLMGVNLIVLAVAVAAGAAQLSIPEFLVNAGGGVSLPISLDDASGVASIDLQVNFDPGHLTLLDVESGTLGDQFTMLHTENDGTIHFSFIRGEELANGSGLLAILEFEMKDGAPAGLSTPVALASYSLGNSSGVVALQRNGTAAAANGKIEVTDSVDIDNHGNGLPDWWEQQYGLYQFSPGGVDVDGDTMDNLSEFIAGTVPTNPFSVFQVEGATMETPGFVLDWQSVSGRVYAVNWTDTLTNTFLNIATNLAYPQNSYTDTVHAAEGEGFYQIEVKLEN